ncbi:DBL homology (DH-domain) [Glarea lozoyensis ATCC 20868]|uniref:DBL homology (DH-domain) n=1 Tax=Glarea lozoyensis (strain ATCC 20868 / MF5171) TaxID=1116229 RepID=S3DBC4_GLAL2|nr:DBL homology (DH-domain) [Glarea lozoyensis ATCC 20868]EPE35045.1 DBL homology (DH-domain) [Glarea lozoyensis ATCC 20868]
MAEYQQGRPNGGRPSDYGHASNYQRDAAFSNIFGSAPPGRSQTMNSSIAPPSNGINGRTQTMGSSAGIPTQAGMQRQPPPRVPQQGGYPSTSAPMMQNGGGMSNGYHQGPRPQQSGQVPSQPQPQYLPQQTRPDRRPYPGPQRVDPRGLPQQQQQYPSRGPQPQQRYQGPPALSSDPYRSQSMASIQRPNMYQPPPNTFNPAPVNAFRQPPYQGQASRTTAQGRIVPERQDERTMSLTSYTPDRDQHQTMSGRVIPNRRISSGPQDPQPFALGPRSPGTATRTTSMASSMASTNVGDMSRSMSMASTIISPSERTDSLQHRPSVAKSVSSGTGGGRQKSPLVYPALLSRVAECFRDKVTVGDRTKNGLAYKNAFSGADAVDVISYIIKTTDRNLALLLGRALDAQKFFHDVTYDHRLRDSAVEMYQFRETMMDEPHEVPEVNGVFVLLTECYSPTCTRDQLCYSIACPRRLEQQSRLNLKPQPGLRREKSEASLHDVDEPDEQKLWINTVSQEIADSIDEREKKRQEVISEIMYTERDFVKDLEYLRDFWILPLRSSNAATPSPIPESRKEKTVRTIFSNIIDTPSIHGVSSKFAEALTERQKKHPVVRSVGDIFLEYVPQFEPFIVYGSNQLAGKFEFENERSLNPFFSKFVDETERRKESRKLELNGYLTKPTTRLARYPLLLENVLKYTEAGNPDKDDIPVAMKMIRDLLTRVNAESGKAENRFNLKRLHEQLRFRPNERVDLKLTDEKRELVFKGTLKKSPTDPSDIQAYLFDHAMLLVRVKMIGKKEEVKVYRRPIPLELLSIREMDEVIPKLGVVKRPSSSLIPGSKTGANDGARKEGFPITFRHIGKGGYELTLYANTAGSRNKWMEHIGEQQSILRRRGDFYNRSIMSSGFFSAANRVNCVAPFDGGRKLIYGTDSGIFVSDRRAKDQAAKPVRVLDATSVTQIDVLEEYQLLLVLSQKSLLSYPLSALNPNEPALSKRPKKIQSHCNFFRTGICLGRHLVCCVKSSALSTTIKVFEPNDAMSKGKKQKGFKMFNSGQDELKAFKEFYIPTESSSIHFLKSKLCVACARGFEVVSLETLETQSLLDQADTSLDFVARKENVRPIHIERLNGEFLLNYSEFSFFVNRNGWRARPDWRIDWEGQPQSFALSYPWILAFEANFIEIRNIDTNAVHIVPHKNIRMLHTSTREIIYAYEDERGEDVVAAIDFWPQGRRPDHQAIENNQSSSQHPSTSSRH